MEASESDPPDPALQEARKTLYAHVGTNLLMYQDLEAVLKSVLPMLDPSAMDGTRADMKRRIRAIHRMTLGGLIERLIERSTETSPGFLTFVRRLSRNRNQLAHHFVRTYRVDLRSIEACQAVCESLLLQRRELAHLTQAMYELVVTMLHVETETLFRGKPEYAEQREWVDDLNRRLRRGAAIPASVDESIRRAIADGFTSG